MVGYVDTVFMEVMLDLDLLIGAGGAGDGLFTLLGWVWGDLSGPFHRRGPGRPAEFEGCWALIQHLARPAAAGAHRGCRRGGHPALRCKLWVILTSTARRLSGTPQRIASAERLSGTPQRNASAERLSGTPQRIASADRLSGSTVEPGPWDHQTSGRQRRDRASARLRFDR